MAEFAVQMAELPGRESGYTEREKAMFLGFVAALPDLDRLAEILDPNFERDDATGPFRQTVVGRDEMIAFRRDVVGDSSVPDPDKEHDVTGFFVSRGLARTALLGGEQVELPEGVREVIGVLDVNYLVTKPMELPDGTVLQPGERYTLRVIEAARFRENDPDSPEGWSVVGRRAVFLDGLFPPAAIARETAAHAAGEQWPPFPTEDVLEHGPYTVAV